MKNYTPKPGSFPDRLLKHLNSLGGTVTCPEAAAMFDIEPKNVNGNMKTALQHGLVVKYGVEGNVRFGLPGAAKDVFDAPAPKRGSAGRKVANTKRKGKAVRATRPVAVEAPPAPAPIAALWSDGDIVVCGAQISADGSVVLSDERSRELHKFLQRVYGPLAEAA